LILFFKAGWIRWTIGVAVLSLALWFVHDLRQGAPALENHYRIPQVRQWGTVMKWVGIGLFAEFGTLAAVCMTGVVLFPNRFLRWVTKGPARLFSKGNAFSALAGGLLAAFLEEPLFRLELQPELVREAGGIDGYYLVAVLFAACHWTPYTNLMSMWAFPRSLLFSYLYQSGGVTWIPMLAHGIGDFVYLYLFAWLGRQGLTHERPDAPSSLNRLG